MKSKVVSGLTLTLLMIGMLGLAFNVELVRAGTITVPDDYSTIQSAIDNANEGDTIHVRAGTYYEYVSIHKSISLIGDGGKNTIIKGNVSKNAVVKINANNVLIKGFTIEYALFGIIINSSSHITFFNNYIYHKMQFKDGYSSIGVVLNYSHEITIANNIISTGWTGIRLWFSDNNYIINNMISDRININCCGIEIGYSNNNIIYNNKIINNWSGIAFWGSKSNLFLHNNFINSIDHHVKQSSPYFSNTWDAGNASGGNYWSDYKIRYPNAQELNHSGILDTQYTIDDTNRDNYPLIKPWTPSHVLTHYKYTIY